MSRLGYTFKGLMSCSDMYNSIWLFYANWNDWKGLLGSEGYQLLLLTICVSACLLCTQNTKRQCHRNSLKYQNSETSSLQRVNITELITLSQFHTMLLVSKHYSYYIKFHGSYKRKCKIAELKAPDRTISKYLKTVKSQPCSAFCSLMNV